MAIYRSNTNRTAMLLAGAMLAAGLVVGVLVGRATAPDLASQLVTLRSNATPIAASLEVVRSEYPELVAGGPDSGGATGSLARARSTFESIRTALDTLDPGAAAVAAAALDDLETGVAAKEPADVINGRIEAFGAALDAALGLADAP